MKQTKRKNVFNSITRQKLKKIYIGKLNYRPNTGNHPTMQTITSCRIQMNKKKIQMSDDHCRYILAQSDVNEVTMSRRCCTLAATLSLQLVTIPSEKRSELTRSMTTLINTTTTTTTTMKLSNVRSGLLL